MLTAAQGYQFNTLCKEIESMVPEIKNSTDKISS
jgi:hypothetical protein